MNTDDIIYISLLLLSIPIGFLFKNSTSPQFKSTYSTLVGFLIVLAVCQWDIYHSLLVVLANGILIQILSTRYLPLASFIITFSYLLFFRMTEYFGLPKPLPYSNAVQLILTLKIVGLAFEIHDSENLKRKLAKKVDDTQLEDDFLKLQYEYQSLTSSTAAARPTMFDVFSYSYCYIGILTGPYFKYRTYTDWLNMKHGRYINSLSFMMKRAQSLPLIIGIFLFISKYFTFQDAVSGDFYDSTFSYRIFYMIIIFTLFRLRFYIAWIFAEISCMSAGFGCYPAVCKPRAGLGPKYLIELKGFEFKRETEWSFETVHNIDEYKCEVSPTVKDVLYYWNMTVQFWMANYVFKRIKIRSLGQPVTMAISAYWHGLHPGYYLSMLTTTPCILAETWMERGLKTRLHQRYHRLYDFCTWFVRCRSFDYMSLGFILLRFDLTIKFWSSVFFIGHLTSIFFIILGFALSHLKK